VVHSWLSLDYKVGVIVDPAASILVGRLIPVIVKCQAVGSLTTQVSTSGHSGDLMYRISTLSIVLRFTTEVDRASSTIVRWH